MDRNAPQAALVAGSLTVWAIVGPPIFAAPVAFYLVLWITFAIARRLRVPLRIGRTGPWLVLALGAAIVVAARSAGEIAQTEQLSGLGSLMADRARVERPPVIAPPVIADDHPQTFFVRAPRTSSISVRTGDVHLPSEALGHGVFQIDFDPRVHGRPSERFVIDVGGVRHTRTLQVVRRSAHPRWIATHPRGDFAVTVSEETDTAYVLRRDGHLESVSVGDGPTGCTVTARGAIVVSHRHDDALAIIDPGTLAVSFFDLGTKQGRVQSHGDQLVVGLDHGLAVLTSTSVATATITAVRLDETPDWVSFGQNVDELVWTSVVGTTVHRLRRSEEGTWHATDNPIAIGRPAVTLARSDDHSQVRLTATDYLPKQTTGANHAVADQIITIDLAEWKISDRTAMAGSPIALAPAGETWRVALAGTDRVLHIDGDRIVQTSTLARVFGVGDLGGGAWAATSATDGIIWFVAADGTVTTHRVAPSDGDLARFDPASLLIRRGERAFYESTRSGASCQTCHLHGDEDHGLHDIGHDAPRPTLGLRGVADTAPFLRGASYPDVSGLEHFAQTLLGGYERVVPDRTALLAAYVRTKVLLPVRPMPIDQRRAGVAAFVKARCDLCHTPGSFTNLAQIPSTALFDDQPYGLLDTPTLRGLSSSAPYLYDGRARTVRDVVVRHNAKKRHGYTAALSDGEVDQLVRWLESL